MKRLLVACAALFALASPAMAYTAYPWINAGSTYSGLSTIGYTVLGPDGVTVEAARTTTGVVGLGGGSYVVASGITVPDGSAYYVKWDNKPDLGCGGNCTQLLPGLH